jgi:hypothetical protein
MSSGEEVVYATQRMKTNLKQESKDSQKITGSVAKNILATFCSSDELVVVTTSCIVSEFLQQNRPRSMRRYQLPQVRSVGR